jgi:hypothetical protein
MLEYLEAYAAHHGLVPRIRLSTKVVEVAPEDAERGTWRVVWETSSGERAELVYDGVVVCNGHHWAPRMPEYPGTFTGELIHSKSYKRPATLAGKRVLVIGGGNSACDIAVEAARFAKTAHISMRRGYWFLPKMFLGVPLVELMKPWMPSGAQKLMARGMARVAVGRYEQYGLQHPDHAPLERHPTINSELLYFLRHGEIAPHPDIRRWDGDEIEFVDGVRERFDLVVAATGFDVSFPFVADGVVRWQDGFPQLINGMLSPEYANIYFFGLGQPRYGAGPLVSAAAEMVATMVRTKPKLAVPIGAVLERLGQKPPRTWLADPFKLLRQLRMGQRVVPRLPWIAPRLMAGWKRPARRGSGGKSEPAVVPAVGAGDPRGDADGDVRGRTRGSRQGSLHP